MSTLTDKQIHILDNSDFKVGSRMAVVSADRKTFLGYGVYEGDFHHPDLAEEMAQVAETHPNIPPEERVALAQKIRGGETTMGRNPRLRLDDGRSVWGIECWWGPAAEFVANGYAAKYGAAENDGA